MPPPPTTTLTRRLAISVLVVAVCCIALTASMLTFNVRNYRRDRAPVPTYRGAPRALPDDEHVTSCADSLIVQTMGSWQTVPRYTVGYVTPTVTYSTPFSTPPRWVDAHAFEPQRGLEAIAQVVGTAGASMLLTAEANRPGKGEALYALDGGVGLLPCGATTERTFRNTAALVNVPDMNGLQYVYRDVFGAWRVPCAPEGPMQSLRHDPEGMVRLPNVGPPSSSAVLHVEALPLPAETALVYAFDVAHQTTGASAHLRLGTLDVDGVAKTHDLWDFACTVPTDARVRFARDPDRGVIYVLFCTAKEWRIAALTGMEANGAALESSTIATIAVPLEVGGLSFLWTAGKAVLAFGPVGGDGCVVIVSSIAPATGIFSAPLPLFPSDVRSGIALIPNFATGALLAVGWSFSTSSAVTVELNATTETLIVGVVNRTTLDVGTIEPWAEEISAVVVGRQLYVGGADKRGTAFTLVTWKDSTSVNSPMVAIANNPFAIDKKSTCFLAAGTEEGEALYLLAATASSSVEGASVAYAVNVGMVDLPMFVMVSK